MGVKNRKPSPEIKHTLAVNIVRLRQGKGYTQEELSHRRGFNKGYVSRIEQELMNVGMANLEALSKGLDCLIYDLFAPLKKEADDTPQSQCKESMVAGNEPEETAERARLVPTSALQTLRISKELRRSY